MKLYDGLNELIETSKVTNWAAKIQESRIANFFARAFSEYIQIEDFFSPDDLVENHGTDRKPVYGWSFVELYAYDQTDKKLLLVRNSSTLRIPDELYKKIPSELQEKVPQIINLDDYNKLTFLFESLKSINDSKTQEEFDNFFKENGKRELYFDSETENGYFIFYLGLTFPKILAQHPKTNIYVKLGITIHLNNIVELAIFDSVKDYEKICFFLGDPIFFDLLKYRNKPDELKKHLQQLSSHNKFTTDNSLSKYIEKLPDSKKLYRIQTESLKRVLDHNNKRLEKPQIEQKEVMHYLTKDITAWQALLNSASFKEKAFLIPEVILYRIYLRYRWCIEKNFDYYFKQINSNEKVYLQDGDTNIIYNNSIVNNSSILNKVNQSISSKYEQKIVNFFVNLTIKQIALFSVIMTISLPLIVNFHSTINAWRALFE